MADEPADEVEAEIVEADEYTGYVSKSAIRTLNRHEKARQAVTLRMAGAAYHQIAKQIGVSPQTASRYVKEALEGVPQETTEMIRMINHQRLEHMFMLVWPEVQQKDPWATQQAFNVIDRINKMFGAETAPAAASNTNIGISITQNASPAEYVLAMKAAMGELPKEIIDGTVTVDAYVPEEITPTMDADDEPLAEGL